MIHIYRLLFILLVFSPLLISAQPYIHAQFVYGESGQDEEFQDLVELSDGSYMVAGSVTINALHYDYWLGKVSSNHELQWSVNLGGSDDEIIHSITATTDDAVIVVGTSKSDDGDVGNSLGDTDGWVVKIDNSGSIIWHLVLGGSLEDQLNDIVRLQDDTYLISGYTYSNDGDIVNNKGYTDLWVVKITNDGTVLWSNTYGGTGFDRGRAITLHPNEAQVALVGSTTSGNGDISGTVWGSSDYWTLLLDTDGNIIWEASYGGSLKDGALAATFTFDGDIIVLGDILSIDGDVGINYGEDDQWLIKLDGDNGNLLWDLSLGYSGGDQSKSVITSSNGDIIVVGATFDASLTPPNYLFDIRIASINPDNGFVNWLDLFGGSNYDFGNAIIQNQAGHFIVAGYSDSTDGDVGSGGGKTEPLLIGSPSTLHGYDDAWFFELRYNTPGINSVNTNQTIRLVPNPCNGHFNMQFPIDQTGETAQVTIYNQLAQIVQQKSLVIGVQALSYKLDLSKEKQGIFWVQTCISGNCTTQKIINTP